MKSGKGNRVGGDDRGRGGWRGRRRRGGPWRGRGGSAAIWRRQRQRRPGATAVAGKLHTDNS